MSKKKTLYQKLVMDCEEVTLLSTKIVSGEKISLLNHLRLWYHNLTCPPCGHFHSDNQKIQKIIENQVATNSLMPEEKKLQIQEELESQM